MQLNKEANRTLLHSHLNSIMVMGDSKRLLSSIE